MKKYIIAVVLSAMFIAFGYAAFRYCEDVYLPEQELQKDSDSLNEMVRQIRPEINEDEVKAEAGEEYLEKAEDLNDDVVGWVYIPDTGIDYPIVQCDDNNYYLSHSIDGTADILGVPFLDYRCAGDFSDLVSIVYGHHYTDSPLMFSRINSFKDKAYFDSHSTGQLIVSDSIYTVHFFAYLNVKSRSPVYNTILMTESDKQDYLDTLFSLADFTENYEKEQLFDKHLLLLSTCTYEFDNARGVLVGVIDQN
ncbi:class B sortase [Ruminococcus sp.]|uniref:class B sortase n=1 Tax=Ruminococcus sp. TaxID=41978 RepID=UPI0025F0AA21|nr:class B sortase [Ruminococcus sp.]MBQ8965424.1 class B sortase [Ruminococcus sp.]